jgi:hypothetical protein
VPTNPPLGAVFLRRPPPSPLQCAGFKYWVLPCDSRSLSFLLFAPVVRYPPPPFSITETRVCAGELEHCGSADIDWCLFVRLALWVSCFFAIAFCWCLRSRAARSPTCQYFKIIQRPFDLQPFHPSVHQQHRHTNTAPPKRPRLHSPSPEVEEHLPGLAVEFARSSSSLLSAQDVVHGRRPSAHGGWQCRRPSRGAARADPHGFRLGLTGRRTLKKSAQRLRATR